MANMVQVLAAEFQANPAHIENIIKLIDDGNTIPFIARYRKEMHGSMDDQRLREVADRLEYLRGLEARKNEVIAAIAGQDKLTDELQAAILAAKTLAEVEDFYRPYKQKRKTRASVAKEKGLEPLSAALLLQQKNSPAPEALAQAYINEEAGVLTPEDALQGARDILAEQFSDDAAIRKKLRMLIWQNAAVVTEAAKDEDSVYRLYYEYSEAVSRIPGHRILAVNRGEREGFLKVRIKTDPAAAIAVMERSILTAPCPVTEQVRLAIADSFDRLLFPSLEREIRNDLTDTANTQAIRMFALNLKPLLLQPPVKNRVTLGLDPAYRTGCKLAVVDGTGKVLDTGVIYPVPPHNKVAEAASTVKALIKKHGISAIAIGNGTASRETEQFAADLIKGTDLAYMIVNEAGASVYSASKLAAAEFPQFDVSIRSAVSIARLMQDPLAELVKIDPQSIGVGQYQHDMPQKQLSAALDGVVEDCVNSVGVDVNTASAALLGRVAGISATVAKNIVLYREENGAYKSRKALKKVPKLGDKSYEQSTGFLRVPESRELLDHTGVHPESYEVAGRLLEFCGVTMQDVKAGNTKTLAEKAKTLTKADAERIGAGLPTLQDIAKELVKPGRDPRDELPPPLLRTDVMEIDDLVPGMELTGTVRNVVDFGAFVDIGVHQDGLVHISQITDRYIKHPSEALTTGDIVTVWVLEVQKEKKRISLTMKKPRSKEN